MECLPFVRRLAVIREASRPESPAQFNSKAFPTGRSRRQSSSKSLSTTSTISTESSSDSYSSADYFPDGNDIRRSCKHRLSVTQNNDPSGDGEQMMAFSAHAGINDNRRRGLTPNHLFYNQRDESIDQSTIAYSMDNELEVHIQLTGDDDFLGMTIVGQNYSDGDSSLFVGTVIPGGAVGRDGRIEAGDMMVSVNDVSLEGKSKKQAVEILREAVKSNSGSVQLVVIPCDSMSIYSDRSCARPIDPFLWLAHNSFIQQNEKVMEKIIPQHMSKYGTEGTNSRASSSLSSSMPSTTATKRSMRNGCRRLPLETPVDIIANRLKSYVLTKPRPHSTKSKSIAAASITGGQLREWLYHNVKGFKDLEEVNLYATQLFVMGYITPIRQILDRERVLNTEFTLEENYVVQTRPLSPAVRPTTPSLYSGRNPTTAF